MMKDLIAAWAMPVGIMILWILASMADNHYKDHVGIKSQHPDCIRATE